MERMMGLEPTTFCMANRLTESYWREICIVEPLLDR